MQKAAAVTAEPGTHRHDNGNRPINFTRESKGEGAHAEEHGGKGVLKGVHVDGVKAGITGEAKNLDKAHTYLDDTAVDSHATKAEGPFPSEFSGGSCRRLSEDVFAETAHDHYQADDCGKNGLKGLVTYADQKKYANACANDSGNQKLEENLLVEVAMTGEIGHRTDVTDDESNTVGAVSHRGGHAKEYHDGEAERAAATCDAIDEANDCAQDKEDRILSVLPPGGVYHFASSFCKKFLLSTTFCFWL